MQSVWLFSLVVVVWASLAICKVPKTCPNLQTNTCYFTNVATLKPALNAQYYAVGGLFSVHMRGTDAFTCGSQINPYGVLLSQAFLWSLSYWQQKTNSQISVGAVVFDSCFREDQMIQNLLGFEQCNLRIENIDRHNLVGFVGTGYTDAVSAASLTADMDLTLISPMADNEVLSDHTKYPYFLRTVASQQSDVDIITEVLEHVETKYVAAIYEQSEMATFKAFKMSMMDEDICITANFSMTGEELTDTIAAFVETSLVTLEKTRFVVLFLTPEFAVSFMKQVTANNVVKNMNLIFIIPSSIQTNSPLFDGTNAVATSNAIVLQRQSPVSNELQMAVTAFQTYWTNVVQKVPTPIYPISNPFVTQYLNNTPAAQVLKTHWALASTIMATKAFVDGVQQAGNICGKPDSYLCSAFFDTPSRGSNINQKIRSSSGYFTAIGLNGNFQDGNLNADRISYKVLRRQPDGTFVPVASYTDDKLTFDTPINMLNPYNPGMCQNSPCLQCGEMPTTTTSTTVKTVTSQPEKCVPKNMGDYSVVYYPPGHEITGAYTRDRRMGNEFATRFDIGQRWVIALAVLAGLGILSVMIFEGCILYKLLGTRMGHKWRTMWLGQLLLFGILLCYLTLIAFLFIPTKATCGITRFGVGVSYAVCFAVLLVKLMVILTSKTSDSSLLPGDMEGSNYLKGVYQFLMFVFVVGVQVVIDTQWLITVPPAAVKVIGNGGEEVWVCNHYTFLASGSTMDMTEMSKFVRSQFLNHVLSLVYIMFLILITTILALNAHGIITNHRESVFVGIAAGFSIPIWLAWTLVGGLNKNLAYANEFGDACIAFGLFLTATLILFAMFLPKVRQLVSMGVEGIYFEDDRDTVYAGSVIMAPPSYKSKPNSVIYVNNQGIYSEPMVVGNGDSSNYMRHPGTGNPTPASTYSAPPTYLKRGADSTIRGGSVLRVTDDLSGRRPLEKKRALSEVAYGTASRPRSARGTLPRSRSHTSLGAL